MLSTFPNLALTWDDLDVAARAQTVLPLLVKGVLTAEDAVRALECGVDGIVVSNHGGRQVDGAVAALDALVEVREAVGRDAAVLMDGGVRGGADVLKALALGADAVLLGRPYVYGLAVGGQEGVEQVLSAAAGGDRPHACARRRPRGERARRVMDRGVVLTELGQAALEPILVEPPGPGEVLVRIEATGVCHSDLHVLETGLGHRLPVLLGHEGAGVVEAAGDGVELVPRRPRRPRVALAVRPLPLVPGRRAASAGARHGRSGCARMDGTRLAQAFVTGSFATRTVVPAVAAVVPASCRSSRRA